MKAFTVIPLICLFSCQAVKSDFRPAEPVRSDNQIDILEIQETDCPQIEYFDQYAFNYPLATGREFPNGATLEDFGARVRDFAADSFCAAGLLSIYQQRDHPEAEVYRLVLEPSFHRNVAVEFNVTASNATFVARTWSFKTEERRLSERSRYVYVVGYESNELKVGSLSSEQTSLIRALFDADLVCALGVYQSPMEVDGAVRYFERLVDGEYCVFREWSVPERSKAKANEREILTLVGLTDFIVSY